MNMCMLNLRKWIAPMAVAAVLCAAPSVTFAQQDNIDAVKKRAELNSAKADLEEARKKRDMAVAARWKDRETANQEREMFNEKYNENKEKVDALMSERARLFEDVRVAREDLAQVKLQAERLVQNICLLLQARNVWKLWPSSRNRESPLRLLNV